MKELLLFISILLAAFGVKADCDLRRMEFWPAGPNISQNSLIVIDAYKFSSKIIHQLNHEYPIYLKSGDAKVELHVKEILIGEAGLTQAILMPMNELVAGNSYQLYIENIPGNEMPSTKFWNPETESYDFPIWKVTPGRDVRAPRWKIKPQEVKRTFIAYGCGPETYIYFNFQTLDQSEILIKTSVTSLSSNKTIVCYLKPNDNETLKVGREMCGGAFSFEDGEKFEVAFDLMDASGNSTTWSDHKIAFTKPGNSN